ncbi:hypothetical protein K438DRAFT_1926872 [Mycena galopus ATCC 62051]|nr:hypothetical protein K438DRAFT_1926872 [Mycena galopus ATCC 62051]
MPVHPVMADPQKLLVWFISLVPSAAHGSFPTATRHWLVMNVEGALLPPLVSPPIKMALEWGLQKLNSTCWVGPPQQYSHICEQYLSTITVRRKEENLHFAVDRTTYVVIYSGIPLLTLKTFGRDLAHRTQHTGVRNAMLQDRRRQHRIAGDLQKNGRWF